MTKDTLPAGVVLSLFPGLGLLDRAFEESAFCVVRGPDLIWGGDVRTFHPPAGVFAGVIGGPPCKRFSAFSGLIKHRRLTLAENLIPEFERCVSEAIPAWFLMENVVAAPKPAVAGYIVHDYLFDNRWAGGKQQRRRRFSFGSLEGWKLSLETVLLDDPERIRCVTATDGRRNGHGFGYLNHPERFSSRQLSVGDALEAQGLPRTLLDHCPMTKAGKYLVIGNGVPLPMGRVFAKAIAFLLRSKEQSP